MNYIIIIILIIFCILTYINNKLVKENSKLVKEQSELSEKVISKIEFFTKLVNGIKNNEQQNNNRVN